MCNFEINMADKVWNPVISSESGGADENRVFAGENVKQNHRTTSKRLKVKKRGKSLYKPYRWDIPTLISVCPNFDLFHEDVPDSYIIEVFEVMNNSIMHTFQVLTKNSSRLFKIADQLIWTPNIWMGVVVESENKQYRIDDLVKTKAYIKFIALEPLLGPIKKLKLKKIDWVIVGGESGNRSREMKESWVVSIKNQCVKRKVLFFFKKWGGKTKKAACRALEGTTWSNRPHTVDEMGAEKYYGCAGEEMHPYD